MEGNNTKKKFWDGWSFNKRFIALFAGANILIALVVLVLALVPEIGFQNWYGMIIGIALAECVLLGQFTAIKQGIYRDLVFDYAITAVPYAFLGGIVYYAMFHGGDMGLGVLGALIAAGISLFISLFIYRDLLRKWFPAIPGIAARVVYSVVFSVPFALLGGIAESSLNNIHTLQFGLIGVALGFLLGFVVGFMLLDGKSEHPKITILQMLDLCGVFFLLGQAIGRIGCFFGNCCYGIEVDFDLFPFSYYVYGTLHLGNPFIESISCIIGFAVLFPIYMSKKKNFTGFFISCYCIWYGLERFILEYFRDSAQKLVIFGDFGSSQLVSLLMIAFGIIYIAQYFIRAKVKGKKPIFMTDIGLLSDEYFQYEKTIYAHPHVTPNGEKIIYDKKPEVKSEGASEDV